MPARTFAQLVKTQMEAGRIGVRELARAAGLDPSFFSKVLAGKRNPPWDERVLERMAKALGISPAVLVISAGRIPQRFLGLFQSDRFLRELERGRIPAVPGRPHASGRSSAPPPAPARPRAPKVELTEDLL